MTQYANTSLIPGKEMNMLIC